MPTWPYSPRIKPPFQPNKLILKNFSLEMERKEVEKLNVDIYAYVKGARVWLKDDKQAYAKAIIIESNLETIDTSSQTFQIKARNIESREEKEFFYPETSLDDFPALRTSNEEMPVDDLTTLTHLNEASVLDTVKSRYLDFQNIYTYSGIVLVAVNPFANISGLYTEELVVAYSSSSGQYFTLGSNSSMASDNADVRSVGESKSVELQTSSSIESDGTLNKVQDVGTSGDTKLDPHLFAVADKAWKGVVKMGKNQSIIVSGESGAGKTVSAKYIMRYFAYVGQMKHNHQKRNFLSPKNEFEDIGADEFQVNVEEQVLATNPITEAFGNAKTSRNDNSSRFGKYIQIKFNENSSMVGATLSTYLLERSRVVFQPQGERSYHIFYQLVAGCPKAERRELGLFEGSYNYESQDSSPELNDFLDFPSFDYLCRATKDNEGEDDLSNKWQSIDGVDDGKEFQKTIRSLSQIGIAVSDQWKMFRILAAILHLGNVKINADRSDSPTKRLSGSHENASINSNDPALKFTSKLLGIDVEKIRKWILKRQIVVRGERIVSNLNFSQSMGNRDAIAKYLYSSLFDWLIEVVNTSLQSDSAKHARRFIGVLDIYGFEHFEVNSFEQFCINYANEKLQKEFNRNVFELEQEEYKREQISWSEIEFNDNSECIQLIESKSGILALLDEECWLPSGSDSSLVQKMYQRFSDNFGASSYFEKPRFAKSSFFIRHYAHEVEYNVDGFLEKNKDTMPPEIIDILKDSSNDFCREVMQHSLAIKSIGEEIQDSGRKSASKSKTLSSVFKKSLQSLMQTINETNVHYIRCIKPNESKKAFEFDSIYVLQQLRACGVLETIRISCAGYPSRYGFADFVERFWVAVPGKFWPWKGISGQVKSHYQEGSFNISVNNLINTLKKLVRIILEKTIGNRDKLINQYQIGVSKVFLRAGVGAYLESCRENVLNRAAIKIQAQYRRFHARSEFKNVLRSVLMIQRVYRGYFGRKIARDMRQNFAAVKIQSLWRCFISSKKYQLTIKFIKSLQTRNRGFIARKSAEKLRYESQVLKMQRLIRGSLARINYLKYRESLIKVQSLVRRWFAKKEFKKVKSEQRTVRHFQQRNGALEKKLFELTGLLRDKDKKLEQIQRKKHDLENKLKQQESKLEYTEKQLSDQNQSICQIESSLSQAIEEKEELLKNNRLMKEEMVALTLENKLLVEKIESLKNDSKVQKSGDSEEYIRLKKIISGLQVENNNLKINTDKANLKSSLNSTELTLETIEKPNSSLAFNRRQSFNPEYFIGEDIKSKNLRKHKSIDSLPKRSYRIIDGIGQDEVRVLKMKKSEGMIPHPRHLPWHLNFLMIKFNRPELTREYLMKLVWPKELVDAFIESYIIPPALPPAHQPKHKILEPARMIGVFLTIEIAEGNSANIRSLSSKISKGIHFKTRFRDQNSLLFWLCNSSALIEFSDWLSKNIDRLLRHYQNIGYYRNFPSYSSSQVRLQITNFESEMKQVNRDLYRNLLQKWLGELQTMIVPSILEHEALPGFLEDKKSLYQEHNPPSLFSRIFGSTATEKLGASRSPQSKFSPKEVSIGYMRDKLYTILKDMKAFYISKGLIKETINQILRFIGQTAFNQLMIRPSLRGWQRGMQIQYNITQIDQWLKENELDEYSLHLEPLLQACKLLQIFNGSVENLSVQDQADLILDMCFLLNPWQIKKILNHSSLELIKAISERSVGAELSSEEESSFENREGIFLETHDSFYSVDPVDYLEIAELSNSTQVQSFQLNQISSWMSAHFIEVKDQNTRRRKLELETLPDHIKSKIPTIIKILNEVEFGC